MLTKTQYSMRDWLSLHGLTSEEAQEYCGLISRKIPTGKTREEINTPSVTNLKFSLEQSLANLILPSLRDIIGEKVANSIDLSKVQVVRHKSGELENPYTDWNSELGAPVIHLVWSGTADDLMCLAHEFAHAMQMSLSGGSFMPPVAREVCAFIGELALIRFMKTQSDAAYKALRTVWYQENERYLGSDLARLRVDLRSSQIHYNYRHNYPFARIIAMSLFATRASSDLADIFSSGSASLDKMDLPAIKNDLSNSNIAGSFCQNIADADEDIIAFKMSLSPAALDAVKSGDIDFGWLYRPAQAGCVIADQVKGISHFSGQYWTKWRSLGVFALSAIHRGEADVLPEDFLAEYDRLASEPPALTVSTAAPWVTPLKFDALTALGMAIQQLASSPYHRQFKLSYYLSVEILPPLEAGQLRCYLDADCHPVGLTTWAWLTHQQKQEVHSTGRELRSEEWVGGTHPFVNDWISEPWAFRAIMTEKRDVIFPTKIVSSIRRTSDGRVRRVNKWVGRTLQRKITAETNAKFQIGVSQ